MASKNGKLSLHLDASQDISSSKDSQDGSQTLDTFKLEELVNRHRTTVKTRRRTVEARLRQAQNEGFAELERRGDVEREIFEAERKAAQRPHLEELAQFLEQKKEIESNIERSRDELDRAQIAVSQQLGACIKSRVDALRKCEAADTAICQLSVIS